MKYFTAIFDWPYKLPENFLFFLFDNVDLIDRILIFLLKFVIFFMDKSVT